MKTIKALKFAGIFVFVISLAGCQTTQSNLLATDESQVKLRSIQTRAFDTTDKTKMVRTVISTMQDLNFVVDDANEELGSVSGTKFVNNQVLKLTVIVRPRSETQLLVRANAQWGIQDVVEADQYQDFFSTLEKAIFLTAHNVD